MRVFNNAFQLQTQFMAYASSFRGGIHAISADLEGDGVREIVTSPASKMAPQLKVFDAAGHQLAAAYAFSTAYRDGVQLAAGDLDGDGRDEIVATTNRGGTPKIAIFTYQGGHLTFRRSFYAYSQKLFSGVFVSVGDVNGDGKADIVTVPQVGAGPQVRVFDGNGRAIGGFFAYAKSARTGLTVTLADVNGDGQKEIITAPLRGAAPTVGVWTYRGRRLASFNAYTTRMRTGLTIQAGDVDGDGTVEVVTSVNEGGGPQISIFNWQGGLERRFFAYSSRDRYGVRSAVMDTTGDGVPEIVTVPGKGGQPQARIFNALGTQLAQAYVFGSGFRRGVEVTSGL